MGREAGLARERVTQIAILAHMIETAVGVSSRCRVAAGEASADGVSWSCETPVGESTAVVSAAVTAEGRSDAVDQAAGCVAPGSSTRLVGLVATATLRAVLPGALAAVRESESLAFEDGAEKRKSFLRGRIERFELDGGRNWWRSCEKAGARPAPFRSLIVWGRRTLSLPAGRKDERDRRRDPRFLGRGTHARNSWFGRSCINRGLKRVLRGAEEVSAARLRALTVVERVSDRGGAEAA